LRAVERGDTWFGALLGPVLMGLVVVAALAVSIPVLADEETLLRWVPAVIPALRFGFLGRPSSITPRDADDATNVISTA